MASQVLNLLRPPLPTLFLLHCSSSRTNSSSSSSQLKKAVSLNNQNPNKWMMSSRLELNYYRRGRRRRCLCFFSNNNNDDREEQARKALEGALGGKKNEFERWNKEIQKREEMGGGDDDGGGGRGWFGWRRWFGDGDHFWEEAQQAALTLLGIVFMYLLVAKGELMLAIFFNPLLYALRGTRNGLSSLTSTISRKIYPAASFHDADITLKVDVRESAKESVIRKWGSD